MDLEQHTARDKQVIIMSIGNLLDAHAFNYIVFRVKPGLTSCEDLATALHVSLYNSYIV